MGSDWDLEDLPIQVDFGSEVPIYVQVKNQIRLLLRLQLEPGVQLPTVREMSLKLGINANTVSRIYADLEREGYLARRQGIGTFVADPLPALTSNGSDELPGAALIAETVSQLMALGYSAEQIHTLVNDELARQAESR
jgi:GntR family transcriptional regulator